MKRKRKGKKREKRTNMGKKNKKWNASQVALVVNNPPPSTGDIRDAVLILGLGRSSGRGHGNPLQYSCLEDSMERGAWQATVQGVAKSQTRLKQLSMYSI